MEALKNCPAALAQVEKNIPDRWRRGAESNINDIRALIRIAKVYNSNCK